MARCARVRSYIVLYDIFGHALHAIMPQYVLYVCPPLVYLCNSSLSLWLAAARSEPLPMA
jgi:hypothetical protein